MNVVDFGVWLSLVERCVRDAEVASSNLVTPTIEKQNTLVVFCFFIFRSERVKKSRPKE